MKIEIRNIQGLFPNDYVETIITNQSVQKIGLQEEQFFTDQKYTLTTPMDNHPKDIAREQPIQALVYDKYRLEFAVKSTYSIELMKFGTVTIVDDDNYSTYFAVVTDVAKEQIRGRLWSATVEFYDVNPENYPLGVVQAIDYLESDYVLNTHGFTNTTLFQVWDISQNPQPFYTIHSIIVPDKLTDQPITEPITTADGRLVRPAVINKQYIEGLFFLKEKDKQDVLSLLPLAGQRKVKTQIRVDDQVFNLIETPEFESTKLNASDLWQLKIKFVYKIVNHYEYA